MTPLLRPRAIAVATAVFLAVDGPRSGARLRRLRPAGRPARRRAASCSPSWSPASSPSSAGRRSGHAARSSRSTALTRSASRSRAGPEERESRSVETEHDRVAQALADAEADRIGGRRWSASFGARLEGQRRRSRRRAPSRKRRLDQTDKRAAARSGACASRAEQSRRDEREWALHLRRQVWTAPGRARDALGDMRRTSARLVLRTAMTLVGAAEGAAALPRGRRQRRACSTSLRTRASTHDPTDSAVAQRFAREVIERDATVREDDEADSPASAAPRRTTRSRTCSRSRSTSRTSSGASSCCANSEGGFEEYDDDVLLALGDHAGAVLQNARLHDELRGSYVATVRVLAEAIEAKDPFLRGHSEEVSQLRRRASPTALGLEPRQRRGARVRLAAPRRRARSGSASGSC